MKLAGGAGRAESDRDLFNAIALKYTAKDMYAPSRAARALRVVQTLEKSGWTEHAHVLEVGCGAGFAASYLDGRYASSTGIDYSEAVITSAQQWNRLPKASFRAADFFDFKPEASYDVVFNSSQVPGHNAARWVSCLQRAPECQRPVPAPAPRLHQNRRFYSARQKQLNGAELLHP